MTNKIRVYAINYNRKYYVLQWIDPVTGKRKTESSKCKAKGPAERKAADKEKELNATVPTGDGSQSWPHFVADYLHRSLSGADGATERWHAAKLNVFEAQMKPQTLSDVTAVCLSQYVAKLRALKRSEDTIRGHMIAIGCALRWAESQHLIEKVPVLPEVRKKRGTKTKVKGRNLEFWEFARMLSAVKLEMKPDQVASWRHLLIGLWLSGLRLAEAVTLSWDDPTSPRINLDGEFPLLEIPGEHDKGRQYRLMPMTPDFARFILRTPEDQRHGPVFRPLGESAQVIINETNVSRTISSFGERAKIIVDYKRIKYASAHDLRRTFGTRWSKRVEPIELRDMMRHEQISTTMTFYVGSDAQNIAANLWAKSHRTTKNTTLPRSDSPNTIK